MLKQGLQQRLQQRLSPLQIQTIKLLELPTLELEQRIKKELEDNPVLDDESSEEEEAQAEQPKQVSLSEYKSEDDIPSYKLYVNNRGKDEMPQYNVFSVKESFQQSLNQQLGYRRLDERTRSIAEFVIGSLGGDGYLRRDLNALSDDIYLRLGIETTPEELESILINHIQQFEPIGIGARDLRECLLLQIDAKEDKSAADLNAGTILRSYFDEFTKKHYDKIISKMGITREDLSAAVSEIVKLNPKPGGQVDDSYLEKVQQVVPDFILDNDNGKLTVTMPKFKVPQLKVNRQYAGYLVKSPGSSKETKEAASFVKQKLDSAKWFIEAIKQRQNTLQNTMNAIVDYQREFFLEGDETKLKPMVLKNIAEKTGLDISTISRVVNCKYIQTPFGTYALKYFFSEGMINKSGEEVSTREIKKILKESVEAENKTKPLTDEELVEVLADKGYNVARRTVAKYREQLSIPIARLRKEL